MAKQTAEEVAQGQQAVLEAIGIKHSRERSCWVDGSI